MNSLFTLSLLLVSSFLFAQQNSLSPNLNGGFLSGSPGQVYLQGDYSIMASDRWMLGLATRSELVTGIPLGTDRNESSYLATLGPLARYYFSGPNSRLQWFTQVQLGLGGARSFQQEANLEFISKQEFAYSYQLATGFSWKLLPGMALESTLSYTRGKIGDLIASDNFSLDIQLRPFTGSDEQRYSGKITPKGKWLLDGQLRMATSSTRASYNFIDLNLEALHFLSNRFALGGSLQYEQYPSFSDQKTNMLHAAVQGRFYINPGQKLSIFMLGETGLEHDFGNGIMEFTARTGLGINYFLSDRITIDLTVGPQWHSFRSDTKLGGQFSVKYLIGK